MGLGPPIIALYHQLKELGLFEGVKAVAELGSQNVWCPHRSMMRDLFRAFGRPDPPDQLIEDFANWKGAARDLYEHLGMEYACIDVDERFGSLALDLNFDAIPPEHRDRYDFTTNHGTSEHVLNQYNVFKMVHELTRPGGLMLHAVPFTVHFEHGFLNYQPKFFSALARANAYEPLGVWVGPDWQLSSLVPWHPSLLDHLVISPKTTHLLVVLQRKTVSTEFWAPVGRRGGTAAENVARSFACHVVDGEFYDGARNRFVTKGTVGRAQPAVPRGTPGTASAVPAPTAESLDELPSDDRVASPVGPAVLALYRQLKATGTLDAVQSVVELGSMHVDCEQQWLVLDLLRAFGRPTFPQALEEKIARDDLRARELYEALGFTCTSLDREGGPDVLKLDLDVDPVPVVHRGRYELALNVGASEYLLNQSNVFKAVHDLVRPSGLMLHVVPFTVQLDTAFFNYQPNFFDALARYNSYRTLGTWLGTDPRVPALIPWQPSLLEYLGLSARTAHVLVVLFQKMYPNEFCVPFQGCYESMVPARTLARYRMVIDGTEVTGAQALATNMLPPVAPAGVPESQVVAQLAGVPGIALVRELARRVQLRVDTLRSGRFRQAFTRPLLRRNRG